MLKSFMLATGASAVLGLGTAAAQIAPPPPPPAPPAPPAAYAPPPPPAPPAPSVRSWSGDSVYEYTSPDGKHVTIITNGARALSPEQAERIRKDAMAEAAHARQMAEWARNNARISADQARRMAEEARRSAQITREQAAAIRAQALAAADRSLREIRVFHDGPDGVITSADETDRLRAQVEALRDEVRQLRHEVEKLRRDR